MPWNSESMRLGVELLEILGEKGCGGGWFVGGVEFLEKRASCRFARLSILVEVKSRL